MNAGCGVQEGGLRKSPSASSSRGSGLALKMTCILLYCLLLAKMQSCFPLEDYIPVLIWSMIYFRR